jgi:DNA-binding GntR family transcriptional regulator
MQSWVQLARALRATSGLASPRRVKKIESRACMSVAETRAPFLPPDQASLTERAYKELEELIVTLALKPGQVLSESAIAKHLSIGRTPVREALQQLAREGLVAILPRRGVIVSEINVRSQLELLRVRREVERLMARLAAERATAPELRQFSGLAEAMRRTADAQDDIAFMRLDQQLNGLLAAACRNDYARRTMGLMQGLSRRFWYMHYKKVLDVARCATLHADLAAAIGEGQSEQAAAASDRLIDYLESFTRASLDGA